MLLGLTGIQNILYSLEFYHVIYSSETFILQLIYNLYNLQGYARPRWLRRSGLNETLSF